ncbi:hypothetical protein CDD80_6337 [Ophiocordyceps camponoti-rufipedis]|uniref:Defective in cullin neddylation protein n=1 Tax=Ophiocordyceps camponoti-rufipedis TaxID=2004952 RepID=A0A2C5YSG5_9HYPO|nr:hypothetical protein CDD80_6337 [Ophiocordyceps camponoti-rufipedis]
MAPASSTSQQKALVSDFVGRTGASERQASRYLRLAGNKLNEAVESFFASGNEPKGQSPIETKLDNLFNSLRDDEKDEKDKLEVTSTMDYLGSRLKVNIEDAELLVAFELLQAPHVGEITRKGFVDGWKAAGAGAAHQEHAAHVRRLINSLSTNLPLFKKVYKYTFIVGRDADQKSLSMETAVVYWTILFTEPGRPWKTDKHDWLELWKQFLQEKWTRSVNRDMWNMTLEFALKALADETLSFWSEDGAWPSVIDDFVLWWRGGRGEVMDTDEA